MEVLEVLGVVLLVALELNTGLVKGGIGNTKTVQPDCSPSCLGTLYILDFN